MVGKFFRYLKLYLVLARINFLNSLEYRFDFLTALIPTLFYSVGYIIFMGTVVSKNAKIIGWSFDQMLLLFAVSQFFYYGGWILYRPSLEKFSLAIRTGEFDLFSRLPVNTRFFCSFRQQLPNVVIPFSIAIFLFLYSLRNLTLNLSDAIFFSILFLSGLLIYYNLIFSLASIAFWIIEADDLLYFMDDVGRFGSYPAQVFPSLLRAVLTFVIPIMLLMYVPATAILGILDWKLALLSLAMAIVTWIISQKIWRAGLRRYSSASS